LWTKKYYTLSKINRKETDTTGFEISTKGFINIRILKAIINKYKTLLYNTVKEV